MKFTFAKVDGRIFRQALAIVHHARATAIVQERMTAGRGRPRSYDYATIFTLLAINAMETGGRMHLTDVARVQQRLTRKQRERLDLETDLSYDIIQQAVTALDAAFEETVDETTGEVFGPRLGDFTLADFLTSLAADIIPENIRRTSTVAIDSTDIEAFSRRRSWGKKGTRPAQAEGEGLEADVEAGGLPESTQDGPFAGSNEPGYPKTGPDGRLQHAYDPDVREGYRSGKNRRKKTTFLGWDFHICVSVADEGGEALPPLIVGLSLEPAGSKKSTSGMKAVDAMECQGYRPQTILADRGYTYILPETWAIPLAERSIAQVMDLHPLQRGVHPGPTDWTVEIDGAVFPRYMPKHLWRLPSFEINLSAEETAALRALYDERKRYAYTPLGKPNPVLLTQRYRDPVYANKMRCPNHPESLRLDPARYPTTDCVEGDPCHCKDTVTMGPQDVRHMQLRQRPLYGTTKWMASYGRRNAVESANALIKGHHINITRGSIQVRGTNRTGVLLGFLMAAVNVTLLSTRYGYDVGNPPHLGGHEELVPLPQRRPTSALHRRIRPFKRPKRKSKKPPGEPEKTQRQLEPLWKPVLRPQTPKKPQNPTV